MQAKLCAFCCVQPICCQLYLAGVTQSLISWQEKDMHNYKVQQRATSERKPFPRWLTLGIHDDVGEVDVSKVQLGHNSSCWPALQLHALVHVHHSWLGPSTVLLQPYSPSQQNNFCKVDSACESPQSPPAAIQPITTEHLLQTRQCCMTG